MRWIRIGATSIDTTIAASTGWVISAPSSLRSAACANSTKPNSPACASPSALRTAVGLALPKAIARPATSTPLPTTMAATSSSTSPQFSSTCMRSSRIPMVTKNSPRRTSRKGLMSSSTW